ncbi:hypothetical protein [Trichodesmium erythraeum]|uniref:hypothetical protein n=1 Tax=Trichodesmium erythraeum TaxID=1206 RepID=UPI00003C9EC5
MLRELCARYQETTGIRVSISTMHRAVEKLGLRCKKKVFMPVSKIPQESKSYSTFQVIEPQSAVKWV